jgi:hypothetical protein
MRPLCCTAKLAHAACPDQRDDFMGTEAGTGSQRHGQGMMSGAADEKQKTVKLEKGFRFNPTNGHLTRRDGTDA